MDNCRRNRPHSKRSVNHSFYSLAGRKRGSLARYIYEYAAFFLWTFVRVLLMTRRSAMPHRCETRCGFPYLCRTSARWMGAKLILDITKSRRNSTCRSTVWVKLMDSFHVLRYLEKISFDCADYV